MLNGPSPVTRLMPSPIVIREMPFSNLWRQIQRPTEKHKEEFRNPADEEEEKGV